MTPADNTRGAFLMMASMTAFALNDTCLKAMSFEIPLFQAIFVRGAFVSLILALLAWRMGSFRVSISRRDWILVGIRALAEAMAAYFFISALFQMPFANVAAILQALPLTVTLAGALFFREAVGWRRMLAILIGFLGVVMIVQPGASNFNFYSVYAIIAVFAVTVRDLAARQLSQSVPTMTVATVAAVIVMSFGALGTLTEPWVPFSVTSGLLMSGAVASILGGYVFSVTSMRIGEISFVAPFRYFSLVVALVMGWLVFSEWPNALTLLGSAIVVATGVFTFYREGRARRRARVAA